METPARNGLICTSELGQPKAGRSPNPFMAESIIQTGLGLFVRSSFALTRSLLIALQLVIRILINSKFSPYGLRSAVRAAAAALTPNSAKPNSSVLRTRASRALRSFAPFEPSTQRFSAERVTDSLCRSVSYKRETRVC